MLWVTKDNYFIAKSSQGWNMINCKNTHKCFELCYHYLCDELITMSLVIILCSHYVY
jgi:hypothetical protein